MTSPQEYLNSIGVESGISKRITQAFARMRKGKEGELRTPFMENYSLDEILAKFDAEVWDKRGDTLDERFTEVELSNRNKLGSRSNMLNWEERREKTQLYYTYKWLNGRALESTGNLNTATMLRPTTLEQASFSLPKRTSSGLPFMARKGEVRAITLAHYDEQIRQNLAAVLGTRTQEGNKTRDIWQWPLAANIREATFYRVYLDVVAKKLSWRAALLGPDRVDVAVSQMLQYAMQQRLAMVGLDFSSFDQSVGPELHHYAFEFVASHFRYQYRDELKLVREFFTHIPLLTPDGVWTGAHGVPSGSVWTNEIDSIAQYLIFRQYMYDIDAPMNLYNHQIQGDDGLYVIPRSQVETFVSRFQEWGLTVNEDKSQYWDDACLYLQRYYSPKYMLKGKGYIGGLYPVHRALNRLLFLERWVSLKERTLQWRTYYFLRAISILENCKYNPLFVSLVRFWRNHTPDLNLSFSNREIKEFTEIRDTERGGLVNQYGDGAIGSFETMRILKAMS